MLFILFSFSPTPLPLHLQHIPTKFKTKLVTAAFRHKLTSAWKSCCLFVPQILVFFDSSQTCKHVNKQGKNKVALKG